MAAIKEARENMGDYKLKTAKDYVVPESQRVNADKKRIQLLNLLDQVTGLLLLPNSNFQIPTRSGLLSSTLS